MKTLILKKTSDRSIGNPESKIYAANQNSAQSEAKGNNF